MTRRRASTRNGSRHPSAVDGGPSARRQRTVAWAALGGVVTVALVVAATVGLWPEQPPGRDLPRTDARSAEPRTSVPADSPSAPPGTKAEPVEPEPVPAVVSPAPAAPPTESADTPPPAVEAIRQEETELAARVAADFPRSSDAMALSAVMHSGRGNVAEAMEYWKKSLEIYPKRVDAYNSIGMMQKLAGQDEQAVASWSKALQIDPAHAEVRDRLARALIDLGRADEAVAALEKGIQRGTPTGMSRHLLGQAYQQSGDFEQARRNYLAAAAIQPDLAECYYGLAAVCTRLDQQEEAQTYRRRFSELKSVQLKLRTDPEIVPDAVARARQSMARTATSAGRIYLVHGHARTGVQYWKQAAALDPDNVACRTELARWYQRNQRRDEALRWYAEVVRIDPENARYRQVYEQLQERK